MTVLYRRPSGYGDVLLRWEPEDEQAGAESVAAAIEDVPDAETALAEAPHDVNASTAEDVRAEYAGIMQTNE